MLNEKSEKQRRKWSVWLVRPGGQGGFVEQVELGWALKEDGDRRGLGSGTGTLLKNPEPQT